MRTASNLTTEQNRFSIWRALGELTTYASASEGFSNSTVYIWSCSRLGNSIQKLTKSLGIQRARLRLVYAFRFYDDTMRFCVPNKCFLLLWAKYSYRAENYLGCKLYKFDRVRESFALITVAAHLFAISVNEIIVTVCVAEKSDAVNGKSETDYETLRGRYGNFVSFAFKIWFDRGDYGYFCVDSQLYLNKQP